MSTLLTRIAVSLLAVMVFWWSIRQISAKKLVAGRYKRHFHRLPAKGIGRMAKFTLPISALILVGCVPPLITWVQANWWRLVMFSIVAAMVAAAVRWLPRVIELVYQASKAVASDKSKLYHERAKWIDWLHP